MIAILFQAFDLARSKAWKKYGNQVLANISGTRRDTENLRTPKKLSWSQCSNAMLNLPVASLVFKTQLIEQIIFIK